MRILHFVPILALLLLSGCVMPGSGMTQIRIVGRVTDEHSQPVVGRNLFLIQGAGYGLNGSDSRMGKPEDYGHYDQHIDLVTDETGAFSHEFDPTTYSISSWVFPPLGARPSRAPDPGLLCKIEGQDNEVWMLTFKPASVDAVLRKNKANYPQSEQQPARITGRSVWRKDTQPKSHEVQLDIVLLSPRPKTDEE